MKRTWIDYTESFEPGPMTFWVHRPIGATQWADARDYDPPLPRPVPGLGYARFHVDFDGVRFDFQERRAQDDP